MILYSEDLDNQGLYELYYSQQLGQQEHEQREKRKESLRQTRRKDIQPNIDERGTEGPKH